MVLDTNVVLDWLLFDDPAVRALATAVCTGRLRWLVTGRLRDELAEVLRRGLAAARGADAATILAAHDRLATPWPRPVAPSALRCADPDDQPFIDLALAAEARWLVSRDRAVLKLHRPARAVGCSIVTPERWQGDP